MGKIRELIQKYWVLDAMSIGAGILVLQALFSGVDTMINAAMIQAGWCSKENAICLMTEYIVIILIMIFVGIIVQLAFDWYYEKNLFGKPPSLNTIDLKNNSETSKISYSVFPEISTKRIHSCSQCHFGYPIDDVPELNSLSINIATIRCPKCIFSKKRGYSGKGKLGKLHA